MDPENALCGFHAGGAPGVSEDQWLLIAGIHLVQRPQLSWADVLFNQDVKGQSMNSEAKRNRIRLLECCQGAAQLLPTRPTFHSSG